jgi:hypothetical protein
MNGCYIGRGSLLVSVLGTNRGFISLSGNSDITLIIEEDNESVVDARHGVNERVDWYVRNYRARLEALCYDIQPDTLELLLKSNYTLPTPSAGIDYVLPNPINLEETYFLTPKVTDLTVTDALSAGVTPTKYTLEPGYGLITFHDLTGYTQPITCTVDHDTYDSFALHSTDKILVQAIFKGTNKITGREVMAHFYRLTLDVTEEFKLVQKPFSPLNVRMQATPDTSQPLDSTIGQYGRIMLL